RQSLKDALNVGDRLTLRPLPAASDLFSGDRLASPRVPRLFAGQLEQERLSAADVDDERSCGGVHSDPRSPAIVVWDLPACEDELLQGFGEIVVVDRGLDKFISAAGYASRRPCGVSSRGKNRARSSGVRFGVCSVRNSVPA